MHCQVSENAKTGGFVEKECYGYIPSIQLSVCWYYLGDMKKRFSIIVRRARINLTGENF